MRFNLHIIQNVYMVIQQMKIRIENIEMLEV